MTPSWTLRRLQTVDDDQIDGLASVLIDCVEGGASVSFMHPLTRERAVAFWRRVAEGVAAGERALLIVEVEFPPRARVAFETGARDVRIQQQVWVLQGTIDVTVGAERHRLRDGDCLAMQLDRPTMFHNPTRRAARYAVVIASETPTKR